MSQITSVFVHKIVAQHDQALDKRSYLSSISIDPDASVTPSLMVSDNDYYALFERLAREDPNGLQLPLRTGAPMRCDDYGAFGLGRQLAEELLL